MTEQPSGMTERTVSRRKVLIGGARAACGAACAGIALAALSEKSEAVAPPALRPPGALPDDAFLGACVRCGLCVRDCPYDTLDLADWNDPVATGTPYFVARNIPCEMCEDIPCVAACPSGALNRDLTDIDDARMGTAMVVGRDTCLNLLGLRCDVCYRVCPLIDEAITLDERPNVRTGKHTIFEPVVHAGKCTGCGKCEKSCVLEEAAIKVLPMTLAASGADDHYRLGWEEKRKRGKSLLNDVLELPDRGYEAGRPLATPNSVGGYQEFKP